MKTRNHKIYFIFTDLVSLENVSLILKKYFFVVFILFNVNFSYSQSCGQGGTKITIGGSIVSTTQTACVNQQINYGYTGAAPYSMPSWSISPSSAGNFVNGINQGSSVSIIWLTAGTLRMDYPNPNPQCEQLYYSIATPGVISGPSSVCYGGSGSFSISGNSSSVTWQQCTSGCSTTNDAGWTSVTNSFSNLLVTTQFRAKLNDGTCGLSYSNIITPSLFAQFLPGSISQSGGTYCNNVTIALNNTADASGGNGGISYQWQYNTGGGFTDLVGATQNSYTIPIGQVPNGSTYTYQRLSKAAQCQTSWLASNVLTVSVGTPLDAGSLQASSTICSGTSPTMITGALPAGGGGGYQYTWQQSTDGISWSANLGITTASYDPPENISVRNYYRRMVTATCGSASTNTYFDVYPNVVSGSIGGTQTICAATIPAAFSNVAWPTGGNGSYSYQWQQSTDGINFTDISGATGSTYSGIAQSVTTYFRRKETSCGVTVNSNTITVSVYSGIVAGSIGSNQTVCSGLAPAAFTNVASPTGGNGTYTYQWQRSTDGTNYIDISGAISSTYTAGAQSVVTYFRRSETSCSLTVNSSAISVGLYPDFLPGSIAQSGGMYCTNVSIALNSTSGASGGNGAISYQWQYKTGSGFVDLTGVGVDQPSYTIPIGQIPNGSTYKYQRLSKAAQCQTSWVASNVLTVSVGMSLDAGSLQAPSTICSGTSPTLITGALPTGGGGGYQYTWQQSTNGISWSANLGITTASYDPPEDISVPKYYQRTVTATCGSASSNTYFDVYPILTAGTIAGPASYTICYGGSTSLSLIGNSSPVSWQMCTANCSTTDDTGWVSNPSTNTFSNLTTTTQVRVKLLDAFCGVRYSNLITIVINPLPALSSSLNPPAHISGTAFNYVPSSTTFGATFSWTRSAVAGILEASSSGTGIVNEILRNTTPVEVQVNYLITTIVNTCSTTAQSVLVKVLPPTYPNENYIITRNLLVDNISNPVAIDNLSVDQRSQTIQYFDGIGRPLQTVSTKGSPSKLDIVQPIAYDAFGREPVKYLPYVSGNNGWLKTDFISKDKPGYNSTTNTQYQFYQSTTSKVAMDINPYSQSIFEPSPLNRITEQGAPGSAWQPVTVGTGHTIRKFYEFNQVEDIYLFTYNTDGTIALATSSSLRYYQPNQLYANRTQDEKQNDVIEYVDKEGRTVCKKVQYDGSGASKLYASTYYIYDDLGNLAVVLPPQAVAEILNLNNIH